MTERRETEVIEASRHVFRQMTEIAESDGPPLIQEWGLINRLGKALKALDREEAPTEMSRADHKIDALADLLRHARAYVHNDCSVGGDELIEKIDSELMSVERINGLREKIHKHHDWMEGDAELGVVIVCQGPPRCTLEGDDAVAAQQGGCAFCKRISVQEDGSETTTEPTEQ